MAGPELIEIIGSIKGILSPAFYVLGSVGLFKAALGFKEHLEDPRRVPLSSPLAALMMAGFALGLPNFLSVTAEELIPPSQLASNDAAAREASPEPSPVAAPTPAPDEPKSAIKLDAPPEDAWASDAKPARPGLSAESFAKAQQAAARELEAKGLGAARAAPAQGDGGALAWVCAVLAAAAGLGAAWARKAAKRIASEKQAQALPQVNLDAEAR